MVVQLLEYGLLIDSCSRVEELVVFLDSAAALKHVVLAGLPDRELKVSEWAHIHTVLNGLIHRVMHLATALFVLYKHDP